MAIRIVLYSHDSVGLGHIRRNLALAHALSAGLPELTRQSVTGLLVAGRPEAARFPVPEGWDWLVLPGVERTAAGYASRALDLDLDQAASLRGGTFRASVRAFQPDLVIIDRHPLGVERELEHGLRTLRLDQPDGRIVLGLRDVLDAPEAVAAEWRALGGSAFLRGLLDAIWVYGDPAIHDIASNGELPAGLGDLVAHTGYLANGRVSGREHPVEEPFVLTTVGGGSDGHALAEAAAAAPVPDGMAHIVVTGPQMSTEDRRRVRRAARAGTKILRRVPDALPLMRRAAAVVCMGGYNTVCEVMTTDTPALVVPRTQRRAEQRMRAAGLARTGAIEMLPPWQVDPSAIGAWIAENVGRRVSRDGLSRDGLDRVPELAAQLLAGAAQQREADPIAV